MGRRMDAVSKSKSLPDFQGQDLLSWTGYNFAAMTSEGLKLKVSCSKSTMKGWMVLEPESHPQFQGHLVTVRL